MNANAANFNPHHGGGGGPVGGSGYEGNDNNKGGGYYHPSSHYSQSHHHQHQQPMNNAGYVGGTVETRGAPPPLPLAGRGSNQYPHHHQQHQYPYTASSPFTPNSPPLSHLGISQDQRGPEWYQEEDYDYTNDPNAILAQPPQSHECADHQQPGNYYPTATSIHSFQPHLRGAPISSLSYDPYMNLLYVASHTVPLLSSSSSPSSCHHRVGTSKTNGANISSTAVSASGHSSSVSTTMSNRASLLAVHSTTDGTLCASIAAHREASPPSILDDLSSNLFGSTGKYPKDNPSMLHSSPALTPSVGGGAVSGGFGGHAKLPRHAYRPPFQSYTATTSPSNIPSSSSTTHSHPHVHPHHLMNSPQYHRMGITSIIPTTHTSRSKNPHIITTISPNGIRMHTNGALFLAENDNLKGMICGTIHPSSMSAVGDAANPITTTTVTHITLGGAEVSKYTASTSTTTTEKGNGKNNQTKGHLHCVDIHRDLQIVSSYTIQHISSSPSSSNSNNNSSQTKEIAITDLKTNLYRNNIVAGCTDGTIRLFDGSLRSSSSNGSGGMGEVARVKTQFGGGVAKISVSEDGNLICASGFGSLSLPSAEAPYAFSSENVLLFDVRKLGRGAIVQPFSGVRGGPRFVQFIPGDDRNRLVVGSGLSGGDLEIITPFEQPEINSSMFVHPNLNPGEAITDMCVSGKDLAIGTSLCNVLQYRRLEYDKTTHGHASTASAPASTSLEQRESIVMPPYAPPQSDLSINPSILKRPDYILNAQFPSLQPPTLPHEERTATSSLFNEFVLQSEPALTYKDEVEEIRSLQPKSISSPIVYPPNHVLKMPSRRLLSQNLKQLVSKDIHDFVASVPASELNLDLLSSGGSNNTRHRAVSTRTNRCAGLLNPNKLLFSAKISALCYNANADPRRAAKNRLRPGTGGAENSNAKKGDQGNVDKVTIPRQYRYTSRPPFVNAYNFDYARYNDTDLWAGWDYPPSMPNSYASPVLLVLYFTPEIRSAILKSQYSGQLFSSPSFSSARSQALGAMENNANEKGEEIVLSAELGFLFHQIECLSTNAMNHPDAFSDSTGKTNSAQVGAFVPSNFLTAFASLPEAAALALIDGSAAAVEIARRPEAFYRFLVQYLDRDFSKSELLTEEGGELNKSENVNDFVGKTVQHRSKPGRKIIDSLQGLNFTSVNEFIAGSGPPTVSSTRNLTVDLAYEPFVKPKHESSLHPYFGEVLRYSLCKESRLRAWCETTRSYETVVQRKIATSLPKMLSLSCACAGKKDIQKGLSLWRHNDCSPWLPETIEVELEESGNVIVREYDGITGDWKTFSKETPLPLSVSEVLSSTSYPRKRRYKLQAVVSFIRNNVGSVGENENNQHKDDGLPREGHHVVHVRVPGHYALRSFDHQIRNIEKCANHAEFSDVRVVSGNLSNSSDESSVMEDMSSPFYWTLTSKITKDSFKARCDTVDQKRIQSLECQQSGDEDAWILANGFVVTKTTVEDARTYNVDFKEPCLVFFRDENSLLENEQTLVSDSNDNDEDMIKSSDSSPMSIPISVMYTRSISNGMESLFSRYSPSDLPGDGDLVAIDAEFVRVQHEESIITETGSKKTIYEGRNALARMSIMDCRTGKVIIDDHILPREPVLDYLTRFSGIHQSDLDPSNSPHHLVTLRDAYLKLRLLVDRGCIFVGHGLSQDFFTVNIFVPRSQIIDTVEIFHREKDRYISLRFLANYLLGHDMQQDTHDSIEDAKAAYEIYLKAVDLKKRDVFEKTLTDIYDLGRRTAWKLGVEDVDISNQGKSK